MFAGGTYCLLKALNGVKLLKLFFFFAYILVFSVNMLNITSKENKQYYNYMFAIVIPNLLCIILMLHNLPSNKNTFQCSFHFIFCSCCNMSQFFLFFRLHIKLLTFCFICVCWRVTISEAWGGRVPEIISAMTLEKGDISLKSEIFQRRVHLSQKKCKYQLSSSLKASF